jgi:rhodanese-related sulfurtransferase
MSEISCNQLNDLLSRERINLIDVRTPAEFSACHVPNAELTPLDALDPSALEAKFGAGASIYILCQSGGRAKKAQETLRSGSSLNPILVTGGTAGWVAAGLPVNRSSRGIISLERQVRITAGALVVFGILGSWFIHSSLLGLSLFVGAGLIFAGVTDTCGMAMILSRAPWNSRRSTREVYSCAKSQ